MKQDIESSLWVRSKSGCTDASLELYLLYSPFMKSVVYRRFNNIGLEFHHLDDCLQVGSIALLKSISTYDSSKGASFKTYCAIRIDGAVINAIPTFSDRSNAYSVAKKNQSDAVYSLMRVKEDTSLYEVADMLVAMAYSHLLDMEEETVASCDVPYQSMVLQDVKKMLKGYVSRLTSHERFVVEAYYYSDMNFSSIADLLGVTRGRVSQLHASAMEKARDMARAGSVVA